MLASRSAYQSWEGNNGMFQRQCLAKNAKLRFYYRLITI